MATARFNLSAWALGHRTLVIYLMLACLAGGAWSYQRLARNEDPPFTIKTMVVRTLWPGATTTEVMNQVTDRIEKKLEETPYLDHLQSYSRPGESVVFVNLRDSVPARKVKEVWQQVRNKTQDIAATLPAGIAGPYFNDEFGDTFGVIYAFTADGHSHRVLRDRVEDVRAEILRTPDIAKAQLLGAQDEQILIEFSPARLAALGLDADRVLQSLRAQNA
ncbi:MAG TPA: efflux RND transporter permease subunit, partial [Microvirga sp.]|nr:efflux RND transporter permease subunit [Microvirga sp.]